MDFDGELLDAFIASCQEQLADIEAHVLALEGAGGSEHVGAIFRAAHSIKADAAAMGFARASAFAHAVEDVLELVRAGRVAVDRALVDALLGAFDDLRRMVEAPCERADLDCSASLMALGRVLCAALARRPSSEDCVPACAEPDIEAGVFGPRELIESEIRVAQVTIPAAKLDALVDQVGEFAALGARLERSARQDRVLAAVTEDLDRLLAGLRDQVMDLRLVPLKPVFAKFRRLVRDAAAQTGKQVEFQVHGEDTTLDKSAVEHVQGALAHIARNAVDHGIEPPPTRLAAGKTPTGLIRMHARQIGGEVEIVIQDDGRGIDRDKLLRGARERGLVADGAEPALLDLVCLPGLSTAERVSAYSGRGVGMDAARDAIVAMRGSLALTSAPGQGSLVTVRVPLSLAMLDCLRVVVGNATFFVPLPNVEECLERRRGFPRGHDGHAVLDVRGELLPIVGLGRLFESPEGRSDLVSVVVVRAGTRRLGLIVDGIVGHRQIVLKNLSRVMGRVDGILGCSVTEDGQMALVLDIAAIFRLCSASAGWSGSADLA